MNQVTESAVQFDVVTLFPEMFRALTDWGITSRAVKQGRFGLRTWNPRDFTTDNYRTVDDRPYGGGPGMVMLARPLEAAIDAAKAAQAEQGIASTRVVMMSPQGAPLTHDRAVRMAQEPGVVVLCGRYEAIDQRLLDRCVDEEISLGDFVLSGGELPAMAMMDAVVRLLPGVLNDSPRRYRTVSLTACSIVRTTRAPRNTTVCACRTCCSAGIMPRSRSGGGRKH